MKVVSHPGRIRFYGFGAEVIELSERLVLQLMQPLIPEAAMNCDNR